MIYCNVSTELDTTVKFNLNYKSYQWYTSLDTTQKYILYYFTNNYSSSPGELKVSRYAVFKDESVNKNQPYIKVYRDTIYDGFNGSTKVKINGSNKFVEDTLFLNFNVTPVSGSPFNMRCKYLKILP